MENPINNELIEEYKKICGQVQGFKNKLGQIKEGLEKKYLGKMVSFKNKGWNRGFINAIRVEADFDHNRTTLIGIRVEISRKKPQKNYYRHADSRWVNLNEVELLSAAELKKHEDEIARQEAIRVKVVDVLLDNIYKYGKERSWEMEAALTRWMRNNQHDLLNRFVENIDVSKIEKDLAEIVIYVLKRAYSCNGLVAKFMNGKLAFHEKFKELGKTYGYLTSR